LYWPEDILDLRLVSRLKCFYWPFWAFLPRSIRVHNSIKLSHLERYRSSSACITIRLSEGIDPLSNDFPCRSSLTLPAETFLVWGFLRSLEDVVAVFHASGTIHYSTAMLVHLSFFSAYLFVSIPAGIFFGAP
jgi:hypothetical protein